MRKIFQKWPLGGVLGLILLSVSVSTSLDHEKDFSKVASWGCIRIDSAFR